jgi:hypothetical protein
MDHPPSTDSSPRSARRALLTGVAALSAIAAPVVLVAATAGGASAPIDSGRYARSVHTQDASSAVRFVDSAGAVSHRAGSDLVNGELTALRGLVPTGTAAAPGAAPTTTTTAAPAPTTTVAPRRTVQAPAAAAPAAAAPAAAAPAATPVAAGAAPSTSGFAYGDPADPATWDRLAQCEAGGNWATNTGNGYYGGLQFSASSWHGVGGTGLPHQNTREVQIEMGRRLQARAGWGQWPACTRRLHYR